MNKSSGRKEHRGKLRLARLILLIIVAFGCIAIVWKRSDLFYALANLSISAISAILLAKLLVAFSNSLKFQAVTRLFGLDLALTEWISLTAVTTLYAGLLPARLGLVPRAIYLKRKYGFSYAGYLSLTAGNGIVDLFIAILVGLVAVGLSDIGENDREFILNIFILLFFLLVLAILLIWAASCYHVTSGWKKFDDFLQRIQGSLKQYRQNPGKLGICILVAFFYHISRTLALFVCFISVGLAPDLPTVLMIISFVQLSAIIPVTPGNIGITEGAIVWAAAMAGIGSAISLPASVVSRVGSIIVQVVLGLICSYILFGKILVDNKD